MQHNVLAEKTGASEVSRRALIGSEVAVVRAVQLTRGMEPCFRTEQRLLCTEGDCEWRKECRRLVAVWRR